MTLKPHVDLRALAEHLGLSMATVSRALNDHAAIALKTRQRVAEAAASLGYRPNQSAKRLATGRTNTIGIVFPAERLHVWQPIFMDFIIGVSRGLTARDQDFVLSPYSGCGTAVYNRMASSRSVDGVLLTRMQAVDERPALLRALGLPFVAHGRTETDEPFEFIDIDNEEVFASATRHVLDLGHQRIASLNDSTALNFAATRARALRRTMAARGLAADPALQIECVFSEEAGWQATHALMSHADPPTAILCSSLLLAVGVYRALKELGKVPGRDVSVVAHDDLVETTRLDRFSPTLSATSSSVMQAGERAAVILLDRLARENANRALVQEVWPVKLVVRESSGVP